MEVVYAGIDLHSNNSMVVVTNEDDEVLYRKKLRNGLDAICGALAPFAPALKGVVVESTYNWYWLVDGLMDSGYRVHLANTAAIKQYSGLKYSDDSSDAHWLANLLRLGILPEGYVYPKERRPVRDLARKRSRLVQQCTTNIVSIKNLLARNTGATLSAAAVKRLSEEDVDAILPDPDLGLAVKSNLAVVHCLLEQIKRLERRLQSQVRLQDEYNTDSSGSHRRSPAGG